ncbi:MAG: hypothetical protein A2V67_07345 [Deltaproteobacteria bacterium RBG_13_61_14]|nr:MAG: hypothetical protein A2V67_07345 [Deltaproteobacteria bacterium RBG_13_61_14]
MKKLIFLVIVAGLGYALYTHQEQAGEAVRMVFSRPYLSLSDQELMEQEMATQQLLLECYHKKDAHYQAGLKNVDDLNRAEEIRSEIAMSHLALDDLYRERQLRKATRWTGRGLAVIIPAAIFFGVVSRVFRRRPRYRSKFPDGSTALRAPRRAWLRFWKRKPKPEISPVRMGAGKAEILQRLGPPLSRTYFTETESWTYRLPIPSLPNGATHGFTEYQSLTVLFRGDKVFDISWDNTDSDLDPVRLD